MAAKVKAVLIGGTGYGGAEILRRLLFHPEVEVIRVTAVDNWGPNGEYPSTNPVAETTVTVPVCNETPPSTTAAPTSTVAPTSTAAPTTIPTDVLPQTEVRPQVPAGESAAQAQLAFSGFETGPVVLGGAGLIAIGTALLVSTRRRNA